MTGATLLLRQIHPSFVQAGFPTSQAFRPTPKDESKLSAYDRDRISPDDAWRHFTQVWMLASAGVMAVSVDECAAEMLAARPDPLTDCAEHVLIDFSGKSDGDCRRIGKRLQAKAAVRGWLHQAPP